MVDYLPSRKHGQFTATLKHEYQHDLNCPCMQHNKVPPRVAIKTSIRSTRGGITTNIKRTTWK